MTAKELRKKEAEAPTHVERSEQCPVFVPPVDIRESVSDVVLLADMPGVDENNVDVDLEGDVLTIRGHGEETTPQGHSLNYREYRSGNYERSFTLSRDIDREAVTAVMKNGVLRLTLPKAKEAQPKRITVKAG
ncbi:MAG: Hsp20/alpha crystallin family protein [Candidatus Pacebacteria bacterium]|nr:Hsp20/alpha crystallin family protein [Candidatus Paceibacterota bacterium]